MLHLYLEPNSLLFIISSDEIQLNFNQADSKLLKMHTKSHAMTFSFEITYHELITERIKIILFQST
jgi:hypothetical protein